MQTPPSFSPKCSVPGGPAPLLAPCSQYPFPLTAVIWTSPLSPAVDWYFHDGVRVHSPRIGFAAWSFGHARPSAQDHVPGGGPASLAVSPPPPARLCHNLVQMQCPIPTTAVHTLCRAGISHLIPVLEGSNIPCSPFSPRSMSPSEPTTEAMHHPHCECWPIRLKIGAD